MGPLSELFLDPAGLVGLLALIPLVIIYLLRPDPRELAVPTYRFLSDEAGNEGQSTAIRRIRRSLLFILQALVLVLLAVSLASPYIQTTQATQEGSTVIVVDSSASMNAVGPDGETRFQRAVTTARDELAEETTLIMSAPRTRTVLTRADPETARQRLGELAPTEASGELRQAITRASGLGGDGARIVVISDFNSDTGWRGAVAAARGRGQTVELRQAAGGGTDNVGIIDLGFDGTELTVRVKNTGSSTETRTVSFGGQQKSVELGPGDVGTRTFPLPGGGGIVELSPNDAFPTDDVAAVAAPESATTRVLLVTNNENRYIKTALRVNPSVDLTIKRPPAAVSAQYDVMVFGDVDAGELLEGTRQSARETLSNGGGVVIQAQSDFDRLGLGDISPVEPGPLANTTGSDVTTASGVALVDGITFPAPEKRLGVSLREGRSLVNTSDGTPLVALAESRGGRVMYYGYLSNSSEFSFAARFPVFWKRAVTTLSGKPPVSTLNHQTGDQFEFGGDQEQVEVQAPDGPRRGPAIMLDRVGFYSGPNRKIGASLVSVSESNLTAPDVDTGMASNGDATTEQRPFDLTPVTVGFILLMMVLELGYLYYRGDL